MTILTTIRATDSGCVLAAPFTAPGYTLKLDKRVKKSPVVRSGDTRKALQKVSKSSQLTSGTWLQDGDSTVVCFDLPKGQGELLLA